VLTVDAPRNFVDGFWFFSSVLMVLGTGKHAGKSELCSRVWAWLVRVVVSDCDGV
jgi:hypothetical protein